MVITKKEEKIRMKKFFIQPNPNEDPSFFIRHTGRPTVRAAKMAARKNQVWAHTPAQIWQKNGSEVLINVSDPFLTVKIKNCQINS